MNLFQGFQSSVENQFSFIKEKLDSIQDRMGVFLNRQGMLEKEIGAPTPLYEPCLLVQMTPSEPSSALWRSHPYLFTLFAAVII